MLIYRIELTQLVEGVSLYVPLPNIEIFVHSSDFANILMTYLSYDQVFQSNNQRL